MNPIIYAIPVFLTTILLEAWIGRRRGKHIYDLPDAITSLHHGVLSQVVNTVAKVVTVGIYVAVYQALRLASWPTDSILAWVVAALLFDFFYYWNHRLGHEVGVLWAAHVVHHSSEYFNLSTALRQSSSSALLGWVFYLPMAVMGVPPVMFVIVGVINLLYQYWVHTELIGRLGWVDRVLVTPSNHRVHHGQNDYCIDKNYGGIFIIWDRIFGTFEEERDDEKVCYGIRKPLHSFNPIWGNLHYYVDLWRDSLRAQGLRSKLGVWLAPPGGWPTGPLAHFEPAGFTRFNPAPTRRMCWYVVSQYVVTNVLIVLFLAGFDRLTSPQVFAYSVLIGLTVVAMGGLLEGYAWAKRLERSRLLIAMVACAVFPVWAAFDVPIAARIGFGVLFATALIWMTRQGVASRAGAAA